MTTVAAARQQYAQTVAKRANLHSTRLVEAFATVAREHYLGPGPWQIVVDRRYQLSPDANPIHLYQDRLVAIDVERGLNNGEPRTLALWIAALNLQPGDHLFHVGCGVGYYTAIMATLIGETGRVVAIDIDPELAARARKNLAHFAHVEVHAGDGAQLETGPMDAIFINAGATELRSNWRNGLRQGGRLLIPLTASKRKGGAGIGVMFKVTRRSDSFEVSTVSRVGIFPCIGSRDAAQNELLLAALADDSFENVRSLRLEPHLKDGTCWLHVGDSCFSTRPPKTD